MTFERDDIDGIPRVDAEYCPCEKGRRTPVMNRARSPLPFGGVRFSIKETVCGEHVYVICAAVWNRYRNPHVDPERDAERTRLRALRKLRERVLSLGADRLLTLTYRENMMDYDQAKKDLRKFVARVRKHVPAWKFVAVPEQQERGAYHWHIAICGYMDVKMLRREWLHVICKLDVDLEVVPGFSASAGNVDITPPRKGGAPKIADYISKYLGKGFELGDKPRYTHFYMTSRGLTAATYGYDLVRFRAIDLQEFMTELVEARGKKVKTRWWKDANWEHNGGVRSW